MRTIELRQKAKECGIKYFRILNKAELTEILEVPKDSSNHEAIIDKAIVCWKGGWGTRKAKKTITTKQLGEICTKALAKATS